MPTLRQKMNELERSQRRKEVDPDALEYGDGTAAQYGSDSDEDHHDFLPEVERTAGTLRGMDSTFESGRYKGARASVKEIMHHDENNDSDDDNIADTAYQALEQKLVTDNAADSEIDSSVDGSESGSASVLDEAQPEREVDDELAALEAEDEAHFVTLSKSSTVDKQRGERVKQQLAFYDQLLESRIRLQRVVADANKLPSENVYKKFCKSSNSIKTACKSSTEELKDLFAVLLDSSIASSVENEETVSATWTPHRNNKRPRDVSSNEYWSALDAVYNSNKQHYYKVLDESYEQVNLGNGKRLKGLKALHQPISVQVKEVLADTERVQRRAHSKKGSIVQIGQRTVQNEDANEIEDEWDYEIYDDATFYQNLLKEFIASSSREDAIATEAANTGNVLGKSSKTRSTHKNVDRRASKGRKLRFAVQPKLVNFMVPSAHPVFHPDDPVTSIATGRGAILDLDNLVRSLFRSSTR